MVNTFLPYANFQASAASLDRQRLGKQRIEAKQILGVLLGHYNGWENHPATKMWGDYEGVLAIYGMRVCEEWVRRGYEDNQLSYFQQMASQLTYCEMPWWFGVREFHRSHQSNLVRKDPLHYGPQFRGVPNDLPYFWPVDISDEEWFHEYPNFRRKDKE